MATGVVVGGIFLSADQQLGVEELAVRAGANLVDGRGVEIDEKRAGNMLAVAGLSEEGLERATLANFLEAGVGATIGTEAVLEEVSGTKQVSQQHGQETGSGSSSQLPGGVTELGTSLAQVKVKNLKN